MYKYFAILITMLFLSTTSRPVSAADAETNKQILKDAAVGAVTGAVAAESTKDENPSVAAVATETPKKHKEKEKKKNKMSKEGNRPPGWDKGKKTGWDGADTPPGLRKEKKKHS